MKQDSTEDALSPRPTTGQPAVVARYSKAKAKDYTEPRRHGYKAKGGPIERRYVEVEK